MKRRSNGRMSDSKANKRIYVLLMLLVMTVILSSAVSNLFAKYVSTQTKQQTATAPQFYFESDLLTEEGAAYTFSSAMGQISFYLYNHADELRVSEIDINYTVTVTCEEEDIATVQGTLSASANGTSARINLPPLTPGKTYTVQAVGENGYTRTLRATFYVTDESGFYKYVDTTNLYFVELTVWTQNTTDTYTVTFPAGLIPDNTCEGLETVQTTGRTFCVNLTPYSSQTFRFFIPDGYTGDYTFSVQDGSGNEALPGTLN